MPFDYSFDSLSASCPACLGARVDGPAGSAVKHIEATGGRHSLVQCKLQARTAADLLIRDRFLPL